MIESVYQNLADAIVLQAVSDYRCALSTLKKHPRDSEARYIKNSCARFFRSPWYNTLTSVDGKLLLQRLNEEANENDC